MPRMHNDLDALPSHDVCVCVCAHTCVGRECCYLSHLGSSHVMRGEQEQYNQEMADLQQLADQTLASAQQEAEAVVDNLQASLADVQVHGPSSIDYI